MNKKLYKRLLTIAMPISLENLIYTLINFLDVFMIGSIGAAAISALGIANQIFFILSCAIFGLLSGSNVLSSQYYGVKDFKSLRKITALNIMISLSIAMLFLLSCIFFKESIISFYTKDEVVLKYSMSYVRIIILTYPLFAIGFSLTMVLRSINLPKYSLYASTLGLVINAVLNISLIPIYGVIGAAFATLVARIATVVFLYYTIYKKAPNIIPKMEDIVEISFDFVKKVLAISFLTFLHEIFWVLAHTIRVMLYGKMGTEAFSAIQIVVSINGLLFTLFIGLANATSIVVGNEIGAKNFKKAYEYSKQSLELLMMMLVVVIGGLNIFAPIILKFMNIENTVYLIAKKLIISQSFVTALSSTSLIFFIGILRAGGDILYSMIMEMALIWLVGIPLTFIAIEVFNLPVYYVYIISWTDDLFKIVPCVMRFISKKWMRRAI